MGDDAEDVLPRPVRWLLRLAWLSVFVVAGYLAWDIRMCTCLLPPDAPLNSREYVASHSTRDMRWAGWRVRLLWACALLWFVGWIVMRLLTVLYAVCGCCISVNRCVFVRVWVSAVDFWQLFSW